MDSSCVVRWLRLAFNCKKWKTTKTQWLKANGCIQEEELKRIEKFVFQQPAVSSMVSLGLFRLTTGDTSDISEVNHLISLP